MLVTGKFARDFRESLIGMFLQQGHRLLSVPVVLDTEASEKLFEVGDIRVLHQQTRAEFVQRLRLGREEVGEMRHELRVGLVLDRLQRDLELDLVHVVEVRQQHRHVEGLLLSLQAIERLEHHYLVRIGQETRRDQRHLGILDGTEILEQANLDDRAAHFFRQQRHARHVDRHTGAVEQVEQAGRVFRLQLERTVDDVFGAQLFVDRRELLDHLVRDNIGLAQLLEQLGRIACRGPGRDCVAEFCHLEQYCLTGTGARTLFHRGLSFRIEYR